MSTKGKLRDPSHSVINLAGDEGQRAALTYTLDRIGEHHLAFQQLADALKVFKDNRPAKDLLEVVDEKVKHLSIAHAVVADIINGRIIRVQ